jgi:hypothetical protein
MTTLVELRPAERNPPRTKPDLGLALVHGAGGPEPCLCLLSHFIARRALWPTVEGPEHRTEHRYEHGYYAAEPEPVHGFILGREGLGAGKDRV